MIPCIFCLGSEQSRLLAESKAYRFIGCDRWVDNPGHLAMYVSMDHME